MRIEEIENIFDKIIRFVKLSFLNSQIATTVGERTNTTDKREHS